MDKIVVNSWTWTGIKEIDIPAPADLYELLEEILDLYSDGWLSERETLFPELRFMMDLENPSKRYADIAPKYEEEYEWLIRMGLLRKVDFSLQE